MESPLRVWLLQQRVPVLLMIISSDKYFNSPKATKRLYKAELYILSSSERSLCQWFETKLSCVSRTSNWSPSTVCFPKHQLPLGLNAWLVLCISSEIHWSSLSKFYHSQYQRMEQKWSILLHSPLLCPYKGGGSKHLCKQSPSNTQFSCSQYTSIQINTTQIYREGLADPQQRPNLQFPNSYILLAGESRYFRQKLKSQRSHGKILSEQGQDFPTARFCIRSTCLLQIPAGSINLLWKSIFTCSCRQICKGFADLCLITNWIFANVNIWLWWKQAAKGLRAPRFFKARQISCSAVMKWCRTSEKHPARRTGKSPSLSVLSEVFLIKIFQFLSSYALQHRAPWGRASPHIYRGHPALQWLFALRKGPMTHSLI